MCTWGVPRVHMTYSTVPTCLVVKGVGQIYVIYGTTAAFPAKFRLTDLDGDNGFRINGIGTVDYFGVYSRKGGDFNADGRDDLIIGASGQGNSYVIYGRDPWAAVQGPPTPVAFNAATSPGFLPIAFNALPDSEALAFNELADPTGPTPLPPSTSVVLGDPQTPGDIRPNLFSPVAPLRPSTQDLNGAAESMASTPTNTGDGMSQPVGTNTSNLPSTNGDGTTNVQPQVQSRGGGGAASMAFLLICMLLIRRKRLNL